MSARRLLRALLGVIGSGAGLVAWSALAAADDRVAPGVAAQGEPDPVAQGVALRKQGRDAEALALFERAYGQHPSARTLAQIALAEQALARWVDAERAFIEALRNQDDPWIEAHRTQLHGSLGYVQGHVGSLAIASNVAGGQVFVDGGLVGALPLPAPLRVAAGDALLEVRAAGFAPVQRRVHVDAGGIADETFTFVAPASAGSTPSDGGPRAGIVAGSAGPPPTATATAGWITLAGAGALLLVGAGGLVTRDLEASIYNDNAQCGPQPGQSRSDRCGTNRNIGEAAQTVAIVGFAGAGAAAIASGVYFLVRPRSPGARGALLECGGVGSALICRGSF
jgi:hypothetical protein